MLLAALAQLRLRVRQQLRHISLQGNDLVDMITMGDCSNHGRDIFHTVLLDVEQRVFGLAAALRAVALLPVVPLEGRRLCADLIGVAPTMAHVTLGAHGGSFIVLLVVALGSVAVLT